MGAIRFNWISACKEGKPTLIVASLSIILPLITHRHAFLNPPQAASYGCKNITVAQHKLEPVTLKSESN